MKFSEITRLVEEKKNISVKKAENDYSKKLEIILNIVNTINKTLVIEDVLSLVLKNAISLTGTERGFIVLKSAEGNLEFSLGISVSQGELTKNDFSISKSVVDDVFITSESRFIESAQSGWEGDKGQSIFNLELQTILCSPLIVSGEKIGVIYVDSKHLHKVKIQGTTKMFEILAGQAATAIRNAQLYNAQLATNELLEESNKQLLIARDEAERSDKLKSDFLTQMSHEIRTPIHVLMSYSGLIKAEIDDSLDSDLKSKFNTIEKAAERIFRTTELILNMSEVSTGAYEYIESEFNIYDTLLVIYNDLKSRVDDSKINFTIDNRLSNSMLRADKYSVHQIFTQIIDNAVTYTAIGEISIILDTTKDGRTEIIIKDSGIGISEKYYPNLFLPFTQEEQGYSRKYDGNGLGLALVKKYCDLNQAKITISSKKGEGTEVKVLF